MRVRSRNGLWLMIFLACLIISGRAASAVDCPPSTVLFAFGGSLFTVEPGKAPIKIAGGFQAPHNLTWSPQCANYAFIDSGSLWVGGPGQEPVKLASQWRVLEYLWSPNGKVIAATVDEPLASGTEGYQLPGDLITLSPGGTASRPLTSDAKNHLLGWSDDSKSVLLMREVSTPCDPTAHECATGDLVALDLDSGLETTLLSAQKLNQDGWSDPAFLGWEARQGVLYVMSQVIPIGGVSLVAAVRVPSGKILWTFGTYGATYLGEGRIATHTRTVEDIEQTGRNWSHKYEIIRAGKVVTQFPVIPSQLVESAGPVSADGRYVLWVDPNYDRLIWRLHFATETRADAWSFELPQGYEPIDMVWAPWNVAIVEAYCKGPQRGRLIDLWMINPEGKEAKSIYQTKAVTADAPNAELLALGGAVLRADGRLQWGRPLLVLADWSR